MSRRSLSTRERLRLFELAGGVCHICGGKIRPGEAWEIEHVIPLAISGDDADENRKPAHVKCHRSKTTEDRRDIARCQRLHAKHIGAKPKRARGFQGWRKFDGTIVRKGQ